MNAIIDMSAIIGDQPPVTQCYILASGTLMVLCSLDVISPFTLYLNWSLIIYERQIWRLLTCFLFFGDFSMSFFWNMYVVVFYCSSLEGVAFHNKSADFLWMLIASSGMLLFLTYFSGNSYFISSAMTDIMIYVWGRKNSTQRMQAFGLIVRAPYLPWVAVVFSLLMGASVQDHLMGIAVGHTYYFFADVYPLLPTSKGFRLFKTPKALMWLLSQRDTGA